MTLPSALGSYEQYKRDTTRFILWLVITARGFGHEICDPAALLNEAPEGPSAMSGRLKGPARKKAREATYAAPTTHTTQATALIQLKKKYPITTETILELADFIARQDMTALMPTFVWYSYKRALKTRRKFAEKYARENLNGKESEDGHIYFLWVLCRCSELIAAKVKVRSVARPVQKVPMNKQHHIGNPEPPMNSPDTNEDEASYDKGAMAEAEKEAVGHAIEDLARQLECDLRAKDEEDIALRKSCLCEDMREMIEEIKSAWENAVEDNTHGRRAKEAVAVLMTEAAIDLVRHREDALTLLAEEKGLPALDPSLDDDDFFGKTWKSLIRIEAERKLVPKLYIFPAKRLSLSDVATHDLHTRDEHEFLVQLLMDSGLELQLAQHWGLGEPILRSFKAPMPSQSLDELTQLYASLGRDSPLSMAMVFVAETLRTVRAKNLPRARANYNDLLLRAMRNEKQIFDYLINTNSVPFWFEDIHESAYAFRAFITKRPFALARHAEMIAQPTKNTLCGMHRDYPKPKFLSEAARAEFERHLERWEISDEAGNSSSRLAYGVLHIVPPQDPDFYRINVPTMRGKLSLVDALTYQETGLAYANFTPHIFAMCHLYNCLKQSGLVKGNWPELEKAIELHVDTIFMSAVPMKADQFVSRMILASGFPSTLVKQARKHMEEPFHKLDWGMNTHKSHVLTPLPVITILRDFIFGRENRLRTWHRLNKELGQDGMHPAQATGGDDLDMLTFIQMLGACEQLHTLIPTLDFDYIGLTAVCDKLFHEIEKIQGKIEYGNQVEKELLDYAEPTVFGYRVAGGIITDLDYINFIEKKNNMSGRMRVKNLRVDAGVKVLQDFLDGLTR